MTARTWLITGVSSGFGRELTRQLLTCGDRVIGTVRDTSKIADLTDRYPDTFIPDMSAAITLMAKQRSGPKLTAQVLFFPVTDASFDTGSYHQSAEGYFLRRDAMQWFWAQYTTDEDQRAEITASPLRANRGDLAGLPKTLMITAEADLLRDEGEAYGRKLREAGVDVTATRYEGIIHDFVMLNALRGTNAAGAAIARAIAYLRSALA
jgi:acetyl esterase/lipase